MIHPKGICQKIKITCTGYNGKMNSHDKNLLEAYRTTAQDALPPEDLLGRLRALGISAMIDAENGLWINEMCMGRHDSVYAQDKVRQWLRGK